MSADELAPLHPDAVGFTLFRVLPNGGSRAYTSVEFTRGWAGAEHFLRQLRACGYVRNSSGTPDGWHVLDVLDKDGDIVQDYAIPPHPSRAFAYIKRKLKLAVVRVDAEAAGSAGSLAMTPNRRGLLAQVDAGHVFRDAIGDSYISADRKVTGKIAEMAAAGWVELDTSRPGGFWRCTLHGRAQRQVRICNYGTHAVAETGPVDDPYVLGETRYDAPRRWLATVGDTVTVSTSASAAAVELRRLAVEALTADLAEQEQDALATPRSEEH